MRRTDRLALSPRLWLAIILVWTLLALLSATGHVAQRAYAGARPDWGRTLGRALLDWYTCAVFTPAIFWVAKRFPLERPHLAAAIGVHAVAMSAYVLIKLALFVPIVRALDWIAPNTRFSDMLIGDAFPLLVAYWGVVGAAYGIDYYRRYQDRAVRAAQLEARLAHVQLDALRAQLNPHFLFNSLNALSELMHRDVGAADRMVVQLGELLRYTLDHSAPQEVSLADELAFIDRYLEIMRVRLGDRLRVQRRIDEAATPALVPNLILQPLVENALRYGIGNSAQAGVLTISAQRTDGRIELEVRDDGPGFPSAQTRDGVGLRNTRLRLAQLYGSEHDIQLFNDRGAVVRVRLPFHVTPLPQQSGDATA